MKSLMLLFISASAAVSFTACKPDAKDLQFVQRHESSYAHRYYDEYEAERIYNLDPQGWHQKRLQSERDTEAFFKFYSNRRVVPGQESTQSGLSDSQGKGGP
jgi:hypothetical protein